MDLAKDIDDILLYWVKRIEPGSTTLNFLWGSPLPGSDGFGKGATSYHGDTFLVSPDGRLPLQNVTLTRGHASSRGFFWAADSDVDARYPKTPFLLTSHAGLKFLRKQQISFVPSREWADLEEDEGGAVAEYWVCNPQWIGLLQIDKEKSNRKGLLWLFSDRVDVSIAPETMLMFCDNPTEAFGATTGA